MKRILMTTSILALVLAACGGGEGGEPGNPEGAWQLESGSLDGTGIPLLESHPVTLTIEEDILGGTAACNHYGGEYTISGSQISMTGLSQTEMACFPEETMEIERLYLDAMSRVTEFAVAEQTLTLSGEGVELSFVELPPVPTAELTGTVWVLDSLVQGDAVSSVMGDPATLELFTDGSLVGSTGCRTLSGRYVVTGAEVAVTDLAATGECPADLEPQDGQVISVLEGGFRVAIDGQTLTLSASGDEGLIYRAES